MNLIAKLVGSVTGNPMLLVWIALGSFALGAVSGAGGAWTIQGWRMGELQARYGGFVASTKQAGEAAERAAEKQIAADKLRKEQADAENKRTIDRLHADVQRLRDANPGASFVPAASPGAERPELACFDRAELGRAVGSLVQDVRGIVDQGDTETVNLDTARIWAAGQGSAPP